MTSLNIFDKEIELKNIKQSFIGYNIGVFCCWAAYGSIYNLQSSINVEGGLGTTTFAVSYIIQGLLSVSLALIMLRKFGAKICYVVGDLAVFLLIVSNIYPAYYTLLPTSILMFILQCATWPSMSMLNVLYAKLYSSITAKNIDRHVIAFSGYFFTTFHSSQVLGNLMSYALLYGFDPIAVTSDNSNCDTNNSLCNSTSIRDYRHCGIRDCQNATIIEESLAKYRPLNPRSFYVLLAVDFVLVAIAVLIQAYLVPNDAVFKKKANYFQQNRPFESREAENLQDSEGEVGIFMCAYGLFDAIFSWLIGKFGRQIGRVPIFLICCAMDCGNYAYVMRWSPGPHDVISIIAVFGTFGIVDGMLQTIINVTHIDFFPKHQDIVLISLNILVAFGFALGLGSSRILCVSSRIYLNLGFILAGTALVVFAEFYNRQAPKSKAEDMTPRLDDPAL